MILHIAFWRRREEAAVPQGSEFPASTWQKSEPGEVRTREGQKLNWLPEDVLLPQTPPLQKTRSP